MAPEEPQCPVCRSGFQGGDVEVSRPIWNFLGKLTVTCQFNCGATHPVSEDANHASNCAFRPLQCRWCPQRHRLEQLAEHEANCSQRPVECPRCQASVTHADLESGVHSCESIGSDDSVLCHCRHRAFGCDWQGPRDEEDQHLAVCWSEQGKNVLHGLVGRIAVLERQKKEDAAQWEALETRMKQEIEMKNEVILRMVAQMEMRLTDQVTSLLINRDKVPLPPPTDLAGPMGGSEEHEAASD